MRSWQRSAIRSLWLLSIVTALLTGAAVCSPADEPAARTIDGIWLGTLKVGVVELRVVFDIGKDVQGKVQATLDSPDQGAKGIPVEVAALQGDDVKIEVKSIRGAFAGKLSADGQQIKGEWRQGG